jgi:sialidase-1
MVATKEGTLLAFCAARKNKGGDWDPIDILMRRSTDYGKTWESPKIIVHEQNLPCDNAMPIVDYETGAVHMLYQIDYARIYYIRSDDDGKTFSEPIEITRTLEQFKKVYPWVVVAPGPGHGIQLYNGRLVVPFWMSNGGGKEFGPNHRGHRPSIVVSVYSDDHGRTWQAGEVACWDTDVTVIPNETSCIQLADGRVLFNMRNESINYRRLFTFSPNGATDWSEPFFADAFFEPICFGSMVRYSMEPKQSKNRILFCNPDSRHDPWVANKQATPRSARNRHRVNLTVRMSYDEGLTWPIGKVLDPEIAGYSDLAVTPDGMIHCFYEGGSLTGSHFKNTHMSVISFDLAWLTDGKDQLDPRDKPLNRPSFDHSLADSVTIGGNAINPKNLPESLKLNRKIGIISDEHIQAKLIHRTANANIRCYETRATKTPGGDYVLMFPEGQHYISKDKGETWSEPRFVFANALAEKTEKKGWMANNCSYIDAFTDNGVLNIFQPHRWRQVIHLTITENELYRLKTQKELFQ